MTPPIQHPAPIWIIVFLFVGGLVLPVLHRRWPQAVHPFALGATACSMLAAVVTMTAVIRSEQALVHHFGGWPPPWGIEFRVDHLSAIMVLLITSLSFLVLLFGHNTLGERLNSRKHFYYSLYLLFTMGMCGFCMTGDFFNLYVFLEITALTGYALVAVGDANAPFAAFRYVILGTLGASFILLGLAYLYGMTGTLNFADMATRLDAVRDTRTVYVALAFLLVGFGLKAALFPLHAWLPDAYTYAPNTTTAFMAAVGTKVGAYAIFRTLYTIYAVDVHDIHRPIVEVMGWMAATAIIVGSLLAIAQTDLKRMLAYSSVAQIGYVILGFSLMNEDGIIGGVLHIVNHAVMKCCLFMVAGAIVLRLGHRDIRRFDGLGSQMPITMAAFTVAAISMVGLPPTAGFFSKWYLVLGAVDAGKWPFVVVILVSSLLNAVYFFRILETIYLRKRRPSKDEPDESPEFTPLPVSALASLGITAGAILVLGFGSWPLVDRVIRWVVPPGLLG